MNTRHNSRTTDAVAALREEIEMEAIISVVGGTHAQRAAKEHRIPDLVAAYMGPKDDENGHA